MSSLPMLLLITIRVYATGDVLTPDLGAVQRSAGAIFQQALVDIDWTDCRKGPKRPRPLVCDVPPQPGELVVRLVAAPGADAHGEVLGDALLDTTTGRGTLSTIYVNRVVDLARAAGTPASDLLGRVVAHEVGHLLLGTHEHSDSGLMRARWPRQVVADRHDRNWTFSDAQIQAMRVRLSHPAADGLELPAN